MKLERRKNDSYK